MNTDIWIGSGVADLDHQLVQSLSLFTSIEPLNMASAENWPSKLSGVIVDNAGISLPVPEWFPIVSVNQLNNEAVRHHFLLRAIILAQLNDLMQNHLTRGCVIAFHSRYKLLLLAHSQPLYREIGPFVAAIEKQPIAQFIVEYRQRLMTLLAIPSTPENHANVLSHMQGYFRPQLEAKKRQALADVIQDYLNKKVTLDVPVDLIKHYMQQYPDPYLSQQAYFNFYPNIAYQ